MLNRIRDFFVDREARSASSSSRHTVDEFNLAAAALLVHAATVDATFDPVERQRILEILETRLTLSVVESRALLEAAEEAVEDSVQILRFTRAVKDNFSYEERVEIIEMLWEVVLADGRLDALESQLMRRIGGLIYVSDRDRGEARQRAAARLKRDTRTK
jgi:uncharacterized tellurite resistance protein B-like protein